MPGVKWVGYPTTSLVIFYPNYSVMANLRDVETWWITRAGYHDLKRGGIVRETFVF